MLSALDAQLLTKFSEAHQDCVMYYGIAMQSIIVLAHGTANPEERELHEIAAAVEALTGETPLWKESLETVGDYLDGCRVLSGKGLATLNGFEGTSAHWLCTLVLKRFTEALQSGGKTAMRSQTDPRYNYEVQAHELFMKQWFHHLSEAAAAPRTSRRRAPTKIKFQGATVTAQGN